MHSGSFAPAFTGAHCTKALLKFQSIQILTVEREDSSGGLFLYTVKGSVLMPFSIKKMFLK